MRLVWYVTIGFATLAALLIVNTFVTSETDAQESAGYAMAAALAIVPYVICRALQALSRGFRGH